MESLQMTHARTGSSTCAVKGSESSALHVRASSAYVFTFSSIPSSKQAGYVQGYCQKLDGLELTQKEREEMLASMKLIYKLTLETMDEIEPRGEVSQTDTQTESI